LALVLQHLNGVAYDHSPMFRHWIVLLLKA